MSMTPRDAFALALAAQGLPPEAVDAIFERLESLDALLEHTIERARAQAIEAKVRTVDLLLKQGGEGAVALAQVLLDEISRDLAVTEPSEEGGARA